MTGASPNETYDAEFYQNQVEGSLRSANRVIPIVLDLIGGVTSVADIGCGTGAWLSVFKLNGAKEVFGVDGGAVPEEHFLIDSTEFLAHSFTKPLRLPKRYDLALSVEVAEHMEAEYAEQFVSILCDASDVVLFGAAIPGQGGHNHVNERWPSYWRAIFEARGYRLFDVIRPLIWNDNSVDWWYRQNTFIYVHKSQTDLIEKLERLVGPNPFPVDLVHPDCFLMFMRAQMNPVRIAEQNSLEWIIHSIIPAHRKLCETWVAALVEQNISSTVLYCAGGNAGLGPYLLYLCKQQGIEVKGYVEYLENKPLQVPFDVEQFSISQIPAGVDFGAESFLVASPGFAKQILSHIDEQFGAQHPPLFGSI